MTRTRTVFILPCCIGDVVMATAALTALRRLMPDAHITWAIGRWSRAAVEGHPAVDAWLDTGDAALPTATPSGLLHFARTLRAGCFDIAVSLVRSWTMSTALLLSGIPLRAGLDSGGRGFGYQVRAPVDPALPRHEADLYLEVIRALARFNHAPDPTPGIRANIPVSAAARDSARTKLGAAGGSPAAYWVVHPGGGRNPGMAMDSKRYPPAQLASLTARLTRRLDATPVLVGALGDAPLAEAVLAGLNAAGVRAVSLVGALSFAETAALAADARLYLGSDTGFTHLAAAAGAKTAMLLGPSDPRRYAPFNDEALAVWKPTPLPAGGVAAGAPSDWDWARDGVSVDEAEAQIASWLQRSGTGGVR